ncbi:MAG: deoxyribose-phosphate aldolase [Candidatus Aminicenantes bacterium RBG_13_59_9]|nr:MAG: deoxyribose-phosphate aldolase [Candidatus Aminicenantes bacterium RBG_13_59_9]
MVTYEDIAGMIDHSLLKPNLTDKEIEEGCRIAQEYRVATVCVRPSDVRRAAEILGQSPVRVTTVIGFPHGSTTTAVKVFEAEEAIRNGARELDVVLNIGKLKSKDYDYVRADLEAVTAAAHARSVIVKVIFENCYLEDEEKIAACRISSEVGADFIKTSTGFGTGGAEDRDLKLMREHTALAVRLKAAGGIRTLERAIEVRKLGCTRIGATATVGILERLK